MADVDKISIFVGCDTDQQALLRPGRNHFMGFDREAVTVLVDWMQDWLDRSAK